MLNKFLDPKNDVAFRRIFGTERNKDILIHFLNDVLISNGRATVLDVTFLKSNQDPEIISKKTSIVDILCTDENNNFFIVEMQVAKEKGFIKQAQYYAAKTYASQLNVAGKYYTLKEIVFLAISDFIMFPKKNNYKSDHVILDRETYENDLKDFSFTFLELPKFNKKINQLSNIIEKWLFFFKNAETTDRALLKEIIGNDNIIERVYDELDRFSWTEQELLDYEQAEKYEGTYIASMEQKFDEGMEKGIEKGMKEGLEKGMEKGKKIESIEMAKKLLNLGIDLETIKQSTGLSAEEIEQMAKSN